MIGQVHTKSFCSEDLSLIENYKQAINDETQIWHCHHRLEIDENKTKQQLIDEGKYFNRPASELIFMTPAEHIGLHNKINKTNKKHKKHKKLSLETRKRMSIAAKKRFFSEESREKQRLSILGRHKVWIDKEHNIYKYVK